ncbi:MAG: hypothetical protein Q8T13_19745 [Acidobacteriota bacterium]|nr:hypothetical protein [Acidobacteriota bacterium]
MSSTVRALAFVYLTFAAQAAAAQPGAVPAAIRTAADAISAEQVAWDLAFLASDELRGRNTPSPGFDMAADYITERLARAGLKPGGDAGGFRQHYALHETRVDTNGATLEIAGRRFALGRDFAMQSLAAPTSAELPVVYVGHGWVIPGRKIDPYAGVDVKGKLVLAHGPRALPQGVVVQQLGRVAIDAETPSWPRPRVAPPACSSSPRPPTWFGGTRLRATTPCVANSSRRCPPLTPPRPSPRCCSRRRSPRRCSRASWSLVRRRFALASRRPFRLRSS